MNHKQLPQLLLMKGECCFMVTFSDLIAFTLMIATIVKIVYDITKEH